MCACTSHTQAHTPADARSSLPPCLPPCSPSLRPLPPLPPPPPSPPPPRRRRGARAPPPPLLGRRRLCHSSPRSEGGASRARLVPGVCSWGVAAPAACPVGTGVPPACSMLDPPPVAPVGVVCKAAGWPRCACALRWRLLCVPRLHRPSWMCSPAHTRASHPTHTRTVLPTSVHRSKHRGGWVVGWRDRNARGVLRALLGAASGTRGLGTTLEWMGVSAARISRGGPQAARGRPRRRPPRAPRAQQGQQHQH